MGLLDRILLRRQQKEQAPELLDNISVERCTLFINLPDDISLGGGTLFTNLPDDFSVEGCTQIIYLANGFDDKTTVEKEPDLSIDSSRPGM